MSDISPVPTINSTTDARSTPNMYAAKWGQGMGHTPQAMIFCGLYICVADIDPATTIANGAMTNATMKKSTVDLELS